MCLPFPSAQRGGRFAVSVPKRHRNLNGALRNLSERIGNGAALRALPRTFRCSGEREGARGEVKLTHGLRREECLEGLRGLLSKVAPQHSRATAPVVAGRGNGEAAGAAKLR